MTPQEQNLIAGLIDRVQNTQLPEKDPEAEQMLRQGLGTNPNALYILAQTVLVQQYALEQAQRRLADARQQQQQPKHATSFLGGLFGHNDPTPPPSPAYQPVPNPPMSSGQGVPYGAPSAYAQQSSFGGAPPSGGQGGGFLRSALQTATGVAAGALAFEGIESLMHGFGGGGGAQGFGGFGGGGRPEEVVNNYYGDSDGSRGNDRGLSPDIEDRRDAASLGDDSANLDGTDTGNNFSNDDDSTFDDGTGDTSSFDDGGGGDLGGGGDDSSFS